jgi:hypothetical protein
MGGSSGSGVQRIEPPSYQLPYLQSGLSEARNLYGMGKQITPFSPATTQSQSMITDRATGGDPTINAANDYVQKSLGGGFLGSNPYIDATFNKAALATQGQLASEFGRSGRNVGASEGLRAQQLNDLATSIYGGNYANERNLMQGTLGYAQPLGNQAYTDAQALSGVGAQQEAKTQEQYDAPGTALDQYLARVRGTDYGSTQTVKNPSNPLGGAAGGALLAGSLFGGGIPLLLGGALGGLFG